jgi:hypothetical protein
MIRVQEVGTANRRKHSFLFRVDVCTRIPSIRSEVFVYTDETSGRVMTIFGYPVDQIAQLG